MSDRVSFLTNPTGGAQVLMMNFAGFNAAADALPHIAAAAALIAAQPPASLRTIVDVTGSKCNIEVVESLKQFVAGNRPYIIASAIVGMNGLQRIILDGILTFSSRSNLKSFPARTEALHWLASQ